MPTASNYSTLQQVVKEIEDAAYQRGWQEAMNAVMSAAQGNNSSTVIQAPVKRRKGFKASRRGKSAREGSVPAKTIEFIEKNPGLTGAEVVAGLQENDPSINERTVRTAFNRLRGKTIENRNGRWYPM